MPCTPARQIRLFRRKARLLGRGGAVLLVLAVTAPAAGAGGGVDMLWFGGAAPIPMPDRGAALPLPGGDEEDRRAVLGAAFLAEVMGPRPRVPAVISRGAAGLRDLIASVEAGKAGYDAVVYGARVLPPLPPSRMTLAQIRDWIRATPWQNHAIGRYQIVPRTLEGLIRRLSLPAGTRFSPAIQDRMADVLIADAGYNEFRSGGLTRKAFMENLAAIWAGLPRSDGRSAYHGFNGNRAGMSWQAYLEGMRRAFPG